MMARLWLLLPKEPVSFAETGSFLSGADSITYTEMRIVKKFLFNRIPFLIGPNSLFYSDWNGQSLKSYFAICFSICSSFRNSSP
jgi:hypothetical protein